MSVCNKLDAPEYTCYGAKKGCYNRGKKFEYNGGFEIGKTFKDDILSVFRLQVKDILLIITISLNLLLLNLPP